MYNEATDKIVNAGVADVNYLKIQTAEALEKGARNLRVSDVSEMGENVKDTLHDIENWVYQLKEALSSDCRKIESDINKGAEPVEHIIITHPIPSIIIATGIGAILGMLFYRLRN